MDSMYANFFLYRLEHPSSVLFNFNSLFVKKEKQIKVIYRYLKQLRPNEIKLKYIIIIIEK